MSSSANIQTFSANPIDQAVVLASGTIARGINLPISWKAVKVGIRYLISSSSEPSGGIEAGISGSPRLYLGISSGSFDTSATSSYFMGFRSNTANWVYNSSSANTREFYSWAVGTFRVSRGGTAVSTSADIIVGATARTERVCGVFKPSVLTVLITKPAFNVYTFQSCFSNASATYAGIDSASFWMDMESMALENLTSTATSSTYSITASHAVVFDKAMLIWNKFSTTASLAVLDFAVSAFDQLYA